ncbi:MAG: nitronate monooxygenase family protein [Dehalococcoidia bacterium]|nr:nitronate monooxygenase family protein [Dehalococcoidia bacterium]
MIETRITKLFGIKYPILCGGMFWVGRAELIAAVANAGGLGFLTAATYPTLEELRADIRKAKDLTDKPIGLNINLFASVRPQPIEEWVQVAIDEKIPVVETSGRSPQAIVAPLHAAGVKIMHKVPGVRYAMTAERLGVDAICVVGHEAGGHPGMDEVTTLVMVPAAADAVKLPLVAGGGFADGRGLVAALALGADAILMGTRFMATQECRGQDAFKDWMVHAAETDTVYCMKSIMNPSRLVKNSVVEKVVEMEKKGATLEEMLPLISRQGPAVVDTGNMEDGLVSMGQAVGLVHDVPTCKELIDRMVEEALSAQERLGGIFKRKAPA